MLLSRSSLSSFSFFNDTATTEIYTLSLHDALPIWGAEMTYSSPTSLLNVDLQPGKPPVLRTEAAGDAARWAAEHRNSDRKSTRLNSSHITISYAVFCLKKKTKRKTT